MNTHKATQLNQTEETGAKKRTEMIHQVNVQNTERKPNNHHFSFTLGSIWY